MAMNYEVRIDDKFLKGDHKDGEVLTSSELNELENVVKTAINANYEDIQKLGGGEIPVGDASTLAGASLSSYNDETLQNSDTKVPTSMQVKQYVDGAVSGIDLEGYYTKREVDDIVATYDSNGNGIVDNAEKVNNHTVNKDVPADAKFTDTIVIKTSELTNDSGFLTSETDPVFNASPAKNITSSNISNWNNKQDKLVSGSNIKTINGANILGSGNVNIPVNLTAGNNISINENNVISATDTKYTGGTNVTIDNNNAINVDLSGKQDILVSGTNIKTVNGTSILGSGNISIEAVQYDTMPTAGVDNLGKIVQYVGTTTSAYTNGYFYKCVSDGQDPATYSWENIQVQVGGGGSSEPIKYYYIETKSGRTEINTITDTIREVYNNIKNNIPFGAYTTRTNTVYKSGNSTNFNMWLVSIENTVSNGSGTVVLRFMGNQTPSGIMIGEMIVTLNITNDDVVSRTQSVSVLSQATIPYQNNVDLSYSHQVLDVDNRKSYTPTRPTHPSTKGYVDDLVTSKTGILNYNAGDYNYIYFNAENTLGTPLPTTEVKKTTYLSNYNIDYTYTTAQAISPATKFLLNLAVMAGSTEISNQSVQLEISILRNNTALKTITKTLDIPRTTGQTANSSTISVQLNFDLGLEAPLEIQANDIFRVKIISMYCNIASYGYLYSSSTSPTYLEQHSNGISAENVYDKIGGTTYSQHEINAMVGNMNINALTGTSVTLTAETVNTLSISENTTFTLPTVTDGKFHQILVIATVTGTPTITWGTNYFFNKETPTIETGTYNFVFEYDGTNWYAGALSKGSAS